MSGKIKIRRSAIHGKGMFAVVDIPAGVRLIEYKGLRITNRQAERLYGGRIETGHTFTLRINGKYIIDANVDGNAARWINHGCDPNCRAVRDEFEGRDRRKDRAFIESKRIIKAGEELTYNYFIVLNERHTQRMKAIWACHCGAPTCTGTMLKQKKRQRRAG